MERGPESFEKRQCPSLNLSRLSGVVCVPPEDGGNVPLVNVAHLWSARTRFGNKGEIQTEYSCVNSSLRITQLSKYDWKLPK